MKMAIRHYSIHCVMIAACGGGTTNPGNTDLCATARQIRATIPGGASGFLTPEQEADITARTIPGGFGGMFRDISRNELVVFLKDPSQQAGADEGLRKVLACGAVYPGWLNVIVSLQTVVYRSAQYTATQLLAYLSAVQALRTDPDVWAIEEDPSLNKIWIGVRSGAAQPRIQQLLAAASVPTGAVVLEVPPPTSGTEPFTILESVVATGELTQLPGVFEFRMHVRYVNQSGGTRYPGRCVSPDPMTFYTLFEYVLTRWDGNAWVLAHEPICEAVAVQPQPVQPGQQETDSIPGIGSHRVNTQPFWLPWRVTGNYRFEGLVYRSTTPNPPFLTDLVALEERVSAPFRVVRISTGQGAAQAKRP
jgi:hypothetical protein